MIIIALAALCFIIPSIVWGMFILAFRLRSNETIGTIVDYHTARGEYGEVSAPVVEFELPDGRKITFTEKTHSNENVFDIVADLFNRFALKRDPNKVKVLYDPNDPQKARVNNFENLYFMPAILFLIGLCILLSAFPATRGLFPPVLDFLERLAGIL